MKLNTKTGHFKDNCNPYHLTFGSYCLNCGVNAPAKQEKPSIKERKDFLKNLGFKFDK